MYELPISTIASETGIDIDMLKKMMVRLKPKIFYIDGWVYLRNFQRHQSTTSLTVQKGIEIETLKIPFKILDKITEINKKLQGIDRVSGGIIYPNLNSNSNLNLKGEDLPTPKDESIKFFEMVNSNSEEYTKFITEFSVRLKIDENLASREVKKFTNHWCEKSASGKKVRWEMEKTFEVQRRLSKWFSNASQWSQEKKSLKTKQIIL